MVSMDELPDYTINVVAYSTNMWGAQLFGLDPTIFYAIMLVLFVAIVAVAVLVITRRKKKR
jgi:cell division protein FtsL